LNTPRIALPNTVTEMNFGLRSAGNGRLARHGRPGQGSTYLRTAIIRYAPGAVGQMEMEHLIRYPERAVGQMEMEHLIRYTPGTVGQMEMEH